MRPTPLVLGTLGSNMASRDERRASIWSVPARVKYLYFSCFALQLGVGAFLVVWEGAVFRTPSLTAAILALWTNLAPLVLTSAALSVLLAEGVETAMVIAADLQRWLDERWERRQAEARKRQAQARRQRVRARAQARARARAEGRAEGHAEGHAEGRREALAAVQEWNERRLAAEARGEPFNEPPPSIEVDLNGTP